MIRLSGSVKLSCAFSSGSPYSRLYGRPPFRLRFEPGSRPRASSASRCLASNRALAARIAASRSCPGGVTPRVTHRRDAPPRNARPPPRRSPARATATLRSRSPDAAPPPASDRNSSPCACWRWRTFVPSIDNLPQVRNAGLARPDAPSTNSALKSDGGETRKSSDGSENSRAANTRGDATSFQLPRQPSGGVSPRLAKIMADLHQSAVGLATTSPLARRRQNPSWRPDRSHGGVPLRQPIPHIRRQQQPISSDPAEYGRKVVVGDRNFLLTATQLSHSLPTAQAPRVKSVAFFPRSLRE